MAALAGALFAFMAVNDDNGCAPDPAETGARAECQVASDCSGDPGVDCVGAWACAAGQCAFECGGTVIETGCYSDRDCSNGYVCNAADVCRPAPGCSDNDSCDAGCYGECVKPVEPPPDACTHSGQCSQGQYCTTETGACDNHCAPGQTCPAVCWGECKPRDNGTVCYGDVDCAMGQFCDRDPCVFPDAADGASDRIACGGVCAAKEGCGGPADCGPGEVCGCAPFPGDAPANGLMPCFLECQPADGVCSADHECGPHQVCQNGRCVEQQRECRDDSQCPAGWLCQSQCDGGFPSDGASDDFAAPPCPSMCVPQGGTCADTGTVCLPGETCVNECYTVCPDCDCDPDSANCVCPCTEECRSACVPDQGGCDPNQCPAGTHCGCPGYPSPTPYNGLYYCEEKCIEDEVPADCWSDAECAPGFYCAPSDCTMPADACNPADESCGARPAPACPGRCEPKQGEYDCKSDENCVGPDGVQGYCRYEVCEAFAPPCDSDDPSCRMPPPLCYGYCQYDSNEQCDPSADMCPAGTHCEESGSCGSAGDRPGFWPCVLEYQCVPDQAQCRSDCDCDPALACNEGVCQRMGRINLCETRCETDCDCDPSMACGAGMCQPMGRMNTCGMDGCTSDGQCHEGDYCKIDYDAPVCACVDCPCSIPHGTCQPRPEVRPCAADADCGADEMCGCGPDPSCPMCDVCLFQCMPKQDDGSCDSDADCARGQHCTFYYPPCAPPPDEGSGFAPPPACEPIGVCEE